MPRISKKVEEKVFDVEELVDVGGESEEEEEDEIEYGYGEMRESDNIRKVNEERLPPVPSLKPSFDALEEWMDELTDKQADRLITHIYRIHPRIDRKQADPDATRSIDKVVGKISKEYMEKTHGGGNYSFIIKDDNIGKKIMESRVNIPMEIEPILDLKELVIEHPLNKGYINRLKAQGRLNANLEPVIVKNEGERQMEAMTEQQKELIGLIREMRIDERDMVMQQLKGRDDSSSKAQLELMLLASKNSIDMVREQAMQERKNPGEMLELVKLITDTLQTTRGNSGDGNMALMMQMMMKQNELNNQMMIEMMRQKADPASNDLDKLVKLVEVAKLLNPAGESGGWVDKLVDKGTELLPSILGTLNQAFALSAMKQGNGVSPQQQQQVIQQMAQGMGNPGMGGNEMDEKMKMAEGFVTQYGGMILMKLDQGKLGDEAADDFYQAFGMGILEQIRDAVRTVGVENVIRAAERNEQVRFHIVNKLGGMEEFGKWCMEFMEWKPEDVLGEENNEGSIQ